MIRAFVLLAGLAALISVMSYSLTAPAAPKPKAFSDVETKADAFARAHVFPVFTLDQEDQRGMGTAFVAKIGKRTLLITAEHVCSDATKAFILRANSQSYNLKILAMSGFADVCFIEMPKKLKVKGAYVIKQPDSLKGVSLAYGFPKAINLIRYIVKQDGTANSDIPSHDPTIRFLFMRGSIYPGMSGGPIVDPVTNKVVGITVATYLGSEEALAVLPSIVLSEAKRLLK